MNSVYSFKCSVCGRYEQISTFSEDNVLDIDHKCQDCCISSTWLCEQICERQGKHTMLNGSCAVCHIKEMYAAIPENNSTPVDPKQACATKKMTFDPIPITLKLLAAGGAQSGADKYGAYNWLGLPDETMSLMTYINAVERHLTLYKAGQDRTSDTDIHNLDSIIVGLAVVRDAMIFNKVKDDRVKLSEEHLVILEKIINKETKL